MHHKKINLSTALAGQKLGLKEVDDGIWLVTFMNYDLGYIDLEQRTPQNIDNPFGARLSPVPQGQSPRVTATEYCPSLSPEAKALSTSVSMIRSAGKRIRPCGRGFPSVPRDAALHGGR